MLFRSDLSESNLRVKLSPETIEFITDRLRLGLRPLGIGATLMAAGFLAALTLGPNGPWIAWTLFGLGALRLWTGLK